MEIHTETIIDAPALEAWRVLGEQFGDAGTWTSILRATSIDGEPRVGATRTCYVDNTKQSTEVLTEFDPEAMLLAYVATSGNPPWLLKGTNHWSIEPLGANRCRVRIQPSLGLAWWIRPFGSLIRIAVKLMLRRAGEELKHRIEQGRPHPRKLAAMRRNPVLSGGH